MWWEGRAGDGVGKGPARSHLLAWVTNCQQWLPVPSIFRASWLGRWVVTHSLANRTSTATSQVLLMKALTPLASWAIKWLRRWPTRESHFQMISSGMGKLPNYNGGAIQGLCERDSLSLLSYSKCWEWKIKSSCHFVTSVGENMYEIQGNMDLSETS